MTLLSPDRKYRYLLTRQTGFGEGACAFLMLNPSTADEEHDDQTIRTCIRFANSWGFGELKVVNLPPFRATNRQDLKSEGPEPPDVWLKNVESIEEAARTSALLVAAYGPSGEWEGRAERILNLLDSLGVYVYCLWKTAGGYPHHPLYLPHTLRPTVYQEPREPSRPPPLEGRLGTGKHPIMDYLMD